MVFTRSIRDVLDAGWSYSGGWTDSTAFWGALGTGHVKYATTSNQVATYTLGSTHGFTGGTVIGYSYAGLGTTNAAVDVDGSTLVQSAWNQKTGNNTSADPRLFCPRIVSYGFNLNPVKGSAQTIHITSGNDGNYTIICGIELYTASAPVSGRVGRTGHSMESAVIDQFTKGPNPLGHGPGFVNYLNANKYLGISWTDFVQAVPSEDLAEGSVNSGLAGGPNGAGAYPQFTNQTFYDNTAVLTPAWMRHEACNLWPNVGGHAPRLGVGLFTTDADYFAGFSQWAGCLFNYGVYFHGNVNDAGYLSLLDDPGPGNVLNGASATGASDITATGNWASGTGTWTATTTIAGGGTGTTAAMSQNVDLATINSRLAAIGSIYVASSAIGAGSIFTANGNKVTLTAIGTPGVSPTINIGGAVGGVGTIGIAVTVAARSKIAAGPGYALKRIQDRIRADMVRPMLAITPAPKIAFIGCPNVSNGAQQVPVIYPGSGSNLGAYEQIDNMTIALLEEPWIKTVAGGTNPMFFVPVRGPMTGFPSNVSNADSHPNNVGHAAILKALIDGHEKSLSNSYRPTGVYYGGVTP